MEDFNRNFTQINFDDDNSPLQIVLKFKDDFEGTWERNENNTLRFSEVKKILAQIRTCYFQKIKTSEHTDKYGNSHNNSVHKILIPIEEEKALELQCSINEEKLNQFEKAYSYFVKKGKEIVFIVAPQKDVEVCECVFSVHSKENMGKGKEFTDFYMKVEDLKVPTIDVNKEKDKQIWNNYVKALKKLVKQKESIWKIQKVSQVYTEANSGGDRVDFIDITISEDDLNKKFEKDIENFFHSKDIEDYNVNGKNAFVEFSTYRILSQTEIDSLANMASEYFFMISKKSPIHTFSGELNFKYTDAESKEEIYEVIREKLNDDYGFGEISIGSTGRINITEKDFPHVKKCIDNYFQNIATIVKDDKTLLQVDFLVDNIDTHRIKQLLSNKNLTKANAYLSKDNRQVVIEVSAPLKQDFLSEIGMTLEKRIFRFGNGKKKNSFVPVQGFDIIDGEYQTAEQIDYKVKLRDLQNANEDLTIKMLPTRYYFGFQQQNISLLRDIKTKTDLQDKSNFDIKKSQLTIYADSEDEYQKQIQRIKSQLPENVILEDKNYTSSFCIQLNTEIETKRKGIVLDLQNKLRSLNYNINWDSLKNNSRVLFEYEFKTEDERDAFKNTIHEECRIYQQYLDVNFENEYGHTSYEFEKNESLELEKEKETTKNVSRATFVFLTKEQYEDLKKKIEESGDDALFRDGIQIGTLVRKDKNKLKFKITEQFDDYSIKSRENIQNIKDGYVKPIFPGELANIGRMIRAMAKVTTPGEFQKGIGNVGYPANKNLPNFLFDPTLARPSSQDLEEEKKRILENLNEPLLAKQPKQLEAVAKSLIATDMTLIQGPPGTGKTTVIAEIIWQTLLQNPDARILVTSQTNLAVDNALERLKGKKLVRPIRIGNIEKFEDEGKMYSHDRLKQWCEQKVNAKEKNINNNAISQWIEGVCSNCITDESYSSIVEKWKNGLMEHSEMIRNLFFSEYLKNVNVFAATCSECGSRNFADSYQAIINKNKESHGNPVFDVVIMDEASKATPPELVLPLTLGKKVIIIGDHKQLPPMLDEKEFSEALESIGAKELVEDWTKQDYKTSQFEKLFIHSPKDFVASLDTQFRMHEQIMNCISQFYKNQEELVNGLQCGIKSTMDVPDFSNKASRWHGLTLDPFISPDIHTIWVNVEGIEKKIGTSYENKEEIDAIKLILRALKKSEGFNEYNNSFRKEEDKEIGVITYYMPQMNKIRNALYPGFSMDKWRNFEQHKYENEFAIPFRINTVDRFQGMERNIIIVSTVRSNRQIDASGTEIKNDKYPFALGFARELQRVNVGFSRAKRLLIVVGNKKHFANKPEYYEAISKMHQIDVKQLENL